MQGIRIAPALNDENIRISEGPAAKDNVSHGATKQSSAQTARKAFGNITNTQPREFNQQGTVKRRAFGADITNSTSKPTATAKKPAAAQQLKPNIQPAQVAVADPTAVPQAWLTTAQPELSAGKSWEQLQLEREREEDADVERTVQQLLAGMRNITARVFQVYDEDSDDEDALKLFPTVYSLPSWGSAEPIQATSSSIDGTLQCLALCDEVPVDQLLPDIDLPDIDLGAAIALKVDEGLSATGCSAAQQHAVGVSDAVHPADGAGSSNSSLPVNASSSTYLSPQPWHSICTGNARTSPQGAGRSSAQPTHGLQSPDPMPW